LERFRGSQKEDERGLLSIQSSLVAKVNLLQDGTIHIVDIVAKHLFEQERTLIGFLANPLYFNKATCSNDVFGPGFQGPNNIAPQCLIKG
jgi:hypothetical protein